MAGGIATRYSPAERESMAAWDAECMAKPLTASEFRLSEELDRLAAGKIPELWKRGRSQTTTDQQRAAKSEYNRKWREQHPDYNSKYKKRNREKMAAQERERYRAAAARAIISEEASA